MKEKAKRWAKKPTLVETGFTHPKLKLIFPEKIDLGDTDISKLTRVEKFKLLDKLGLGG
jgi:hypothetical protein